VFVGAPAFRMASLTRGCVLPNLVEGSRCQVSAYYQRLGDPLANIAETSCSSAEMGTWLSDSA